MVTSKRITRTSEPTEQTMKLLKVPGGFGDPLQAIYSLPGVVATDEAGGAPAVRGSGPQDNAFIVDFLPASYIFHDFGHSIFNENLIRDFGLKAAGFGSRYGRATGAVFDVSLRDPRIQPLRTTIDASILRAGAMIEGGVGKNQSFYVAARSSVIDKLLDASDYEPDEEDDLSFDQFPKDHDYQMKYLWRLGSRHRLEASAIGARDEAAATFGARSDDALLDPGTVGRASIDREFSSQAVRWIFDGGAHRLQTALGHLGESRLNKQGNGAEFLDIDTDEWTFRSQYDYRLSSAHTLSAGVEYRRSTHDYGLRLRYRSCTSFSPECETDKGEMTELDDEQEIETADAYVEDIWTLAPGVTLTSGVHFARNEYLDESHAEPRIAARWQLSPALELHASWGRYHQLPEIEQIVPVFGNPTLASPEAMHYVFGGTIRPDELWSITADVYYKDLRNVVVDVPEPTMYVNAATGKAYGAELLVNRDAGERWYGWLSVSASKTERRNELTGESIPFDYDVPVVANLVLNYRISSRWEAGLRWNLRSGMPYSPIIGNKPNPDYPGYYLPVYGELNSERAKPYHRLDLRIEHTFDYGRVEGSYYLDIINAYARKNGGAVRYEATEGSSNYRLEEEEGLPFFPSFGVKITF
ncbi:TonB-dependent receptor [Steroidobacter sp. S1-65]|uniref:TonB-dependent receptor n=1 Tax=Steroidobacter gossypii TaxID=2805490 RepID=A0ABS1X2C8_9GAMM|nr:TonB-dependent receptor [Steroidobacter gossypii]MBM0107387.1 TonB-dependent receptor [Steroidobacter gossypii]